VQGRDRIVCSEFLLPPRLGEYSADGAVQRPNVWVTLSMTLFLLIFESNSIASLAISSSLAV
jgi:hypothetical protein